jgi:hypothetical protein
VTFMSATTTTSSGRTYRRRRGKGPARTGTLQAAPTSPPGGVIEPHATMEHAGQSVSTTGRIGWACYIRPSGLRYASDQDWQGVLHRDHPGSTSAGGALRRMSSLRHRSLGSAEYRGFSAATRIAGPHDLSGQCAPKL